MIEIYRELKKEYDKTLSNYTLLSLVFLSFEILISDPDNTEVVKFLSFDDWDHSFGNNAYVFSSVGKQTLVDLRNEYAKLNGNVEIDLEDFIDFLKKKGHMVAYIIRSGPSFVL